MAVDISSQLRAIANDEYGETVLSNVGSAVEELSDGIKTDVSDELATIYHGVYGRDIRKAIYDALFKLSVASPSGGSGGVVTGVPVAVAVGVMGAAALTGEVEEE